MTQQSGNQFDDDLTVGLEDDGAFSTDSIDLFEFSGGDESPIARLKTIILSIDWEINDDILQQLEDELVDLGDIWEGDKIKQVYVQGLSKIGKYIYKEKADANPNSIKLLVTFYHNLEKIVSSDGEMSEDEKKELLLADVKKFDRLKVQIGQSSIGTKKVTPVVPSMPSKVISDSDEADELNFLKAQVLGIDWEIDDDELEKLGDEVKRLEGVYSSSNGKRILLQGIGALSSYIKKMKSKSNTKVFTLLHSFLDVLEKTPSGHLPAGEAKQRLLAEVEKFKSFKAEIAQAQLEPEPVASVAKPSPKVVLEVSREVLPVEDDDSEKVASDVESRLSSVFGDMDDDSNLSADKNVALEGVNVETDADDDSDEEALPFYDNGVAPALSEVDEESSFSVEKLAGDLAKSYEPEEQEEEELLGSEILPGVDVESEADDDSDEEALPFEDGEIAPALSGSFDDSGFDKAELTDKIDDSDSYDLDSKLGSFFDDEVQSSSKEWGGEQEEPAAEETVGEESVEFDLLDDGALAPALSESEESLPLDIPIEETVEEQLSFFDDDVAVPELDDPIGDMGEDEISHEKAAEAQLSFLDEAISESGELDGIFEEKLESDNEIAGFFDDTSPVVALSDREDSSFEEEALEETAEEQLSFLGEDIPAPEASIEADKSFFEDETDRESLDENLSFLDDDAPVPALSEDSEEVNAKMALEEIEEGIFVESIDIEEVALEEEFSEGEESFEEELSFIDEETELAEIADEAEGIVEINGSDESKESFDKDEIKFNVPGEISKAGVAHFTDEQESFDDVIDFQAHGEDESTGIPLGSVAEESESEEVVFEAVGDDVEVDLLPGEEFADSTVEEQADEEYVKFLVAEDEDSQTNTDEHATIDYSSLSDTIKHVQGEVTDTNLQALLVEINRVKTQNSLNTTGKIFLQLLSTINQHIERNIDDLDPTSLSLMNDVYSGMKMSSSSDVPDEQIQQQLLTCINQVILLQQKDIVKAER